MYRNRKGITFSYKDTWSMDSTLAPIILNGLTKYYEVIQIKSDICGCPNDVIQELFPDMERFNHSEEQIQAGIDEWYRIIENMIYAFKYNDSTPKEISSLEDAIYSGEFLDADGKCNYSAYREHPQYELYHTMLAEHEAKVQTGLELFGKYYRNLWW